MRLNNIARAAALAGAALALSACVNTLARLATPAPETNVDALRAGEYRLDPDHATLLFKVDHLGISQFVGRFNAFTASLDFDPKAPDAARVDADVDIASLDINHPEFAKTLLGPQWFDADQFPTASFRTTSVEVVNGDSARVTGDLTLHGVTRPLTLDAGFRGGLTDPINGKYTIGFIAVGSFDRTAFGINRYAGPVGKIVDLEIHAEFVRAKR